MGNLCSEADVRQRVQQWVLASFLATDLQDSAAYLVGAGGDTGLGLIVRWSAQFEFDCGRTLDDASETIVLDGTGTNEIILPKKYTPIISISGIVYSGIGTAVTNYGYDAASGRIWLKEDIFTQLTDATQFGVLRPDLPRWPAGRSNITIALSYGHASVPIVVRGAVADRVAADVLIEDRARRDRGLTSKTLGDRSESYGKGRWNDEVDKLARNYEQAVRGYMSLVTAGVA